MPNPQPDDYALVIGVDEYPNYKPLKGPVNDAERFAAWLTDPNKGGLPTANCQLIKNPDFPVGEITIRLDLILSQIEIARKQKQGYSPRRFYLYFSGHGQSPRIDQVNLCLKMWSSTTLSRLALSAPECWSEMVNCAGSISELRAKPTNSGGVFFKIVCTMSGVSKANSSLQFTA